jgi:hypothetical protein
VAKAMDRDVELIVKRRLEKGSMDLELNDLQDIGYSLLA